MRKVVFWCSIVVMIAAICFGVGYVVSQKRNNAIYEDLKEQVAEQESEETPTPTPETPSESPVPTETLEPAAEEGPYECPIDFNALWEINPEVYAWIEIPGTEIAYPVLQREGDDTYYLNHTIEGASGLPGSIYSEAANAKDFSDFNTVLYGHNMKNGTMFGSLKSYRDETFLDEHREIVIYTPEAEYRYKVFAAVVYNDQHLLYHYDKSNPDDCQKFLDSVWDSRNLNNHVLDDVEVTTESHVLTLSTCIGSQPENRYLVMAVLMEDEAE